MSQYALLGLGFISFRQLPSLKAVCEQVVKLVNCPTLLVSGIYDDDQEIITLSKTDFGK